MSNFTMIRIYILQIDKKKLYQFKKYICFTSYKKILQLCFKGKLEISSIAIYFNNESIHITINSPFEEIEKPQPNLRLISSNETESNLIYAFVKTSHT